MDVKKHTDKYFTYTREILEVKGLDPWILMQIFIRKGPGKIYGIKEATDLIVKESGLDYVNGKIWALRDGQRYHSCEPIMLIEAPLRLIVELETIYLGIISSCTTVANDHQRPNVKSVQGVMDQIVFLAGDRPVYYFGARHWHYDMDAEIAKACFDAGAVGCSTDIGAATVGKKGAGTMPHVLPIIYGDTATAGEAFDDVIDPEVRRVVLVDTFNQEMTDAIDSMDVLQNRMCKNVGLPNYWYDFPAGIRLDTCGENIGEGCHEKTGVTIELARKVRLALDSAGFDECPITLSSGFAEPEKLQRFVSAEQVLGIKLFDSLGVGQLYHSRSATADIVRVDGIDRSKAGRSYVGNDSKKRLKRLNRVV